MELLSAIVTLDTIRQEDLAKPKYLTVWECLGVNPLDMPRTPYWASEIKNAITRHALSTPPSRHHLYVHHSSHQWTALFLSVD